MEIWQQFLMVVLIGFFLLIVFQSMGRVFSKNKQIEEDAKTRRSFLNAEARASLAKTNGIFDIKLAEISGTGEGGEGNEFMELLKLYGAYKNSTGESIRSPVDSPVLTWDELKLQLADPSVKAMLLEHKDEALEILQS